MPGKIDYSLLRQVLIGVVCKYIYRQWRSYSLSHSQTQRQSCRHERASGERERDIKCKTGSASKFHLHSNEAARASMCACERTRMGEFEDRRRARKVEKSTGVRNRSGENDRA